MMNIKIINTIVRSELRWKKKLFVLLIPMQILTVLLVFRYGIENEAVSITLLLTGIISFISFFATPAFLILNNTTRGGQSSSFSWKYIHSIAHDRKSFISGCLVANVISVLPLFFFVMVLSFILKFAGTFFVFAPALFIGSCLLCLTNMLNILSMPRRFNYKYKNNQEADLFKFILKMIRKFFYKLLNLTHILLYFGFLYFFVSFFVKYNPIYGYIALNISLIIVYYTVYLRLINLWADERYLEWDIKRDYKKTLSYFAAFTFFCLLNISVHKKIPGIENDIFDYVNENNLVELKKLEISKKDLQETNSKGSTALLKAVSNGNIPIVEYLISKGANIEDKIKERKNSNEKYLEGFTPLMASVWMNNVPMMKFLISKGANVNAASDEGMSVLSLASAICNPVTMDVLIRAGANINQASKDGLTPLFYSSKWKGCLSSILYLKKLGADEDLKNKKGMNFISYMKEVNPRFYSEYNFYINSIK